MTWFKDKRELLDRKLVALGVARQRVRAETEASDALAKRSSALGEAQGLAQHVAQHVQNQAHQQIAQIVSKCLEAVFDEPYRFQIKFERKRGRTEARLMFERDGLEVDPLTASGGGVVDVAAFALRLACLVLSRPAKRRLLVLDEPFRFVSVEYQDRIRQLLDSLARDMNVQIIMVTHNPKLRAGNVIEIE